MSEDTPSVLHNAPLSGDEPELWRWVYPILRRWARHYLRNCGVKDENTADDLAQDVAMNVRNRWSEQNFEFEEGRGTRLRDFFRRAVFNAAMTEMRRRGRKRADYGDGISEDDRLRALEDSLVTLDNEMDDEYNRRRRAAIKEAIGRVRAEVPPTEYEAFYVHDIEGDGGQRYTARQVAEIVRERLALPDPLEPAWTQRAIYRVRKRFRAELEATGFGEPSDTDSGFAAAELLRVEAEAEHRRTTEDNP